MTRRSFAECSTIHNELATKEAALLIQIDGLILDVQMASALGTDEDYAKAHSKWTVAEQALAEINQQQEALDEDFQFYFDAMDADQAA